MQPQAFTCSRCGAPLPPGSVQCPNCGLAFSAAVPSYPYAPRPQRKTPVGLIILLVAGVGCLPIIAILAAILFPVFAKSRDMARETSSASNLKLLGLALNQYSQDHHEKLPPLDSSAHFKDALKVYIRSSGSDADDVFSEPGGGPYQLNARESNMPMSAIEDPSTVEVARDPVAHSDGKVIVLFADGHIGKRDAYSAQ